MFAVAVLTPLVGNASDWTVYLDRAGPVRIGMSVAAVRRVLADPAAHLEGNAPVVPLNDCAYLESKHIPDGFGFMFAGGRVVRVDVSKAGIRTGSGVAVGDTEDRVKQMYPGRITVTPHPYEPQGHYLNFLPERAAERVNGMVFETDGVKVTSFRVGTLAAIALIEGCS